MSVDATPVPVMVDQEPVVIVEKSGLEILAEKCQADAKFFVEEVIGDHVYPHQERVLKNLGPRIAVHGCHGSGKDRLAAWVAWWFRFVYAPANVYFLGPSEDQVEDAAWQEIKRAADQAKARGFAFGGEFKHLYHECSGGSFMRGIVAKRPENVQGRHAPNQLVIFDEASGISREVHNAAMSILTAENNWAFAIGNPTFDPGAWFPEACRSGQWVVFCFDGYEVAEYQIPGAISWAWIREREESWGKDSQITLAKIRGQFPTEATDNLFALAWIERAMARGKSVWVRNIAYPMTLGVDVARFGSDETVLSVGEGPRVVKQIIRQGQDTMRTVADVQDVAQEYQVEDRNIRVDDTGLGGGVTDRLRELKKFIKAVNFGASARDAKQFGNARTEMYVNMRDMARDDRLILPSDPLLMGDLCGVEYEYTSDRIYKLRPKKEMKKNIGRSPDRADSAVLALIGDECASNYGGAGHQGLLDFYRTRADRISEAQKRPVVSSVPVEHVPGASSILRDLEKR